MSYSSFLFLLFLTFDLMIPNKIQSIQKQKLDKLWIEVDISDVSNTLDIFNIQESKEKKNQKNQHKESMIKSDEKINNLKNVNLKKQKIYKLQLASIKKDKYSNTILTKIEKNNKTLDLGELVSLEVELPAMGNFVRVQTKKVFSKKRADEVCLKILKTKKQCLVVKVK